jgi:hypothetical protein
MEIAEWEKRIEAIHEEFYEQIVGTTECGPFDGGCVVTAQALQKVIGGEIMVLIRSNDRADHAVVLKDDLLWDFDGPAVQCHGTVRHAVPMYPIPPYP